MDELTTLLLRARRGDRNAFAEVVRTMYPPIWRLCVHLNGREDADDAAQETFLEAWRSVSAFRGDASARTWLFVIARRSVERVAVSRRRWTDLAELSPRPATIASAEGTVELDDLLARLPQERREALVLTQLFGLTYAEAAQVCDCQVGTIRSRVARAREELTKRRTTTFDESLAEHSG